MKTKIIAGLVSLASLGMNAQDLSGYVRGVTSLETGTTFIEPNLFMKLPANIDGYHFTTLYDGGYYGETTLTKKISKGLNLKLKTIHNNELHTQTGIGVNKPFTLGKASGSLSLLPVWFGGGNELLSSLDYYVTVPLGKNITISSFGEIRHKKGWMYGEINFEQKINKNLGVTYNALLYGKGNGNVVPNVEHTLGLSYYF